MNIADHKIHCILFVILFLHMISVKELTVVRDTIHNILLLLTTLFLFASINLLSSKAILPFATAQQIHAFLLVPTFLLVCIDIILSMTLRILEGSHMSKQAEIPKQVRTILYTFLALSCFITILLYVI